MEGAPRARSDGAWSCRLAMEMRPHTTRKMRVSGCWGLPLGAAALAVGREHGRLAAPALNALPALG
eukprot:7163279-Pyramimonas_sp.AAC.1